MNCELFLASASPRRRELAADLGLPFVCASPDVDESVPDGTEPHDAALLIAERKAHAAALMPDSAGRIIISADTTVVLGSRVFGKPFGTAQAEQMLRELSGREHQVLTGVCVIMPDGRERAFCESTTVRFFELTDDEIAVYAASGEPLDKAGAYGIQGRGKLLVEAIEGDYFNVMGLPVARLRRVLTELGVPAHCDSPTE